MHPRKKQAMINLARLTSAMSKPAGECIHEWLMEVLDEVERTARKLTAECVPTDQVLPRSVLQTMAQTLESTASWPEFHEMFGDLIYSTLLGAAEQLKDEHEDSAFLAINETRRCVIAANLPEKEGIA
jgi:hypothetical protein